VFQQGGKLHVLDVPSEQLHEIDVTVPDDGTRTGPRWVDAKTAIREQDTSQHTDYDIAPNAIARSSLHAARSSRCRRNTATPAI